ncbi:MAG: BON domain-containing protein [Isosphaeraceae bacterium]
MTGTRDNHLDPARDSSQPPPQETVVEIATRCAWQQVQCRYPALTAVVLEQHDGVYRLGGRVPTYYLKQVALAAACEVAGPRPVINEIEVVTSTSGFVRFAGPRQLHPHHS